MAANTGEQRPKRRRNLSSLFFFGLAVVLLVVAAVTYTRDRNKTETPPPAPTAFPGRNAMTDVLAALEKQGLKDPPFEHRTVSSPVLTPPGQPLDVNGAVLYVFVYNDGPVAAQKEAARVNPASVLPASAGTVTGSPGAPPRIFTHSNVIAVLVGGSDKLAGQVQRAIESLR